jgi:hypothetical protein
MNGDALLEARFPLARTYRWELGRTRQSESGPNGLARLASAANATNKSRGEAEIAGGG